MTLAFDALDAPDSPLARRDPRWKLASLVPAVFAASALRQPVVVAVAFVLSIVLLLAARLPQRLTLIRLGAFALFLSPFLIILPILQGWGGFNSAAVLAGRATTVFGLGLILVTLMTGKRSRQTSCSLLPLPERLLGCWRGTWGGDRDWRSHHSRLGIDLRLPRRPAGTQGRELDG
jgi:energy-coupling factor transporter transmembrane protein EcfT